MIFSKINKFHLCFVVYIIIFILVLAVTVYIRGGKDLKVDIYGAQQTLNKQSPYQNPGGEHDLRPLFRYAPGFAIMAYPFLLQSKPYRVVRTNLEIDDINPSVFAWYFFKILLLFFSAIILLELIPSISRKTSIRNLQISFLMASPLISLELSNGQNKIIALFFMLLALWLFKKSRFFVSALCFCLAMTVYVPLCFFAVYFLLRDRKFIISFIAAVFVIFLLLPSLVFGVNFNISLLKDWFLHLKPFVFANSYASYVDLRVSSQSLPSAVGRIFVSGSTGYFKYLISPFAIHIIIKTATLIMLVVSCLAAWKRLLPDSEGLRYVIFLILAMLLPQYSITYMWSWALVFYFVIFNYISYPEVPQGEKRFMFMLAAVLFIATISIGFKIFNRFSVLFWATVFLWLGVASILIRKTWGKIQLNRSGTQCQSVL